MVALTTVYGAGLGSSWPVQTKYPLFTSGYTLTFNFMFYSYQRLNEEKELKSGYGYTMVGAIESCAQAARPRPSQQHHSGRPDMYQHTYETLVSGYLSGLLIRNTDHQPSISPFDEAAGKQFRSSVWRTARLQCPPTTRSIASSTTKLHMVTSFTLLLTPVNI